MFDGVLLGLTVWDAVCEEVMRPVPDLECVTEGVLDAVCVPVRLAVPVPVPEIVCVCVIVLVSVCVIV